MIKGVFFDLGGTLFSYRHPAEMLKLTVDGICEKLKLEHDAEEITRQFVLANKQIEHEFAEKAFFLAREYLKTTAARMARILPAFGLGGVVNKGVRAEGLDYLRRSYPAPT